MNKNNSSSPINSLTPSPQQQYPQTEAANSPAASSNNKKTCKFTEPAQIEARKQARIEKRHKLTGKAISQTMAASRAEKNNKSIRSNIKDKQTADNLKYNPYTLITAEEYARAQSLLDNNNNSVSHTQPGISPGTIFPSPQNNNNPPRVRNKYNNINNISDNNKKEELYNNIESRENQSEETAQEPASTATTLLFDDSNLFQDPDTQKAFFETAPEFGGVQGELLGDSSFKKIIEQYSKKNLSFILQERQENLCRCVALGYSLSKACKIAGYSYSNSAETARNLYRSPIIHARVKQLLDGDYRGIAPTSPDLIILKLQYLERKALSQDKLKEALECVKLQGQELGMFLPKPKDGDGQGKITIVINDTYETEDGKRTVSKRKIKEAVQLALQAENATDAEIVNDSTDNKETEQNNPLASLVKE